MDATDLLSSEYSTYAIVLAAITYILFSDVIKTAINSYTIEEKVMMMAISLVVFLIIVATIDSNQGGGGS